MVLTYGNVREWNADVVNEAGDTVRKRKERLLGLEDDLAATAVAWTWSGDAATAARQKIRKLNDRAEHLVAEAASVQRALYDASDGVRDLQHAVQDADAKAAANQYTITSDGAIRDDAPPLPPPRSRFEAEEMADIQQHRARVSAELEHEIQRIMTQAGEIDRTLADVMTKAAAGKISDDGAATLAEADENVGRQRELDEILDKYQVDPDPGGLVKYPRNWLLRQFAEQTVTATEADMLDELGLLGLDDFKDIRDDAFDTADERFPSHDGDRNNDHNDAFRHAYWNALMVSEYGAEWAERYGTAHESIPGNEPEREAMDLYNNEIGRRIAIANPDASREELAGLVAEAVTNGETVVIPEGGGRLAFSDQVGPDETGEPALPAPEEGEDPDSDSTGSGEYSGSGSGS